MSCRNPLIFNLSVFCNKKSAHTSWKTKREQATVILVNTHLDKRSFVSGEGGRREGRMERIDGRKRIHSLLPKGRGEMEMEMAMVTTLTQPTAGCSPVQRSDVLKML